jgi:hypothetical protein
VIQSKKPTAAQIKADEIGKAAYNPVLKDLMGSHPTLEQDKAMTDEPGGKKLIFQQCSIRNLEPKKYSRQRATSIRVDPAARPVSESIRRRGPCPGRSGGAVYVSESKLKL